MDAAPPTSSAPTSHLSSLPSSAAHAAKQALENAMSEVTNGAAPGSSARSATNNSTNNRDRATSSASNTGGSKNGKDPEEVEGAAAAEQGEEEKEEGEISQDGISLGRAKNGGEEDIRTVFQDPENFNVKHPLASKWTLWFDNPSQKGMSHSKGSKESWGDDMNKVVDLDCVEEFWGLYHNIIPPSQLPAKANYYLFKEGIQPAWEDPANAKGGKWSVHFPREKSKAQIDTLWLYTMLSAIGETLDAPFPSGTPHAGSPGDAELVTGVIMAARPNYYRIAIWTRNADNETDETTKRLMDIGKHFKVNALGINLEDRIAVSYGTEVEFQSHSESEKKKGRKIVL